MRCGNPNCLRSRCNVSSVTFDRYSSDVLADFNRRPVRTPAPKVEATIDLVVEDVGTDFCGSVISVDGRTVQLEDRHGKRRTFPLGGGFLFEGSPVILVAPAKKAPTGTPRTARPISLSRRKRSYPVAGGSAAQTRARTCTGGYASTRWVRR